MRPPSSAAARRELFLSQVPNGAKFAWVHFFPRLACRAPSSWISKGPPPDFVLTIVFGCVNDRVPSCVVEQSELDKTLPFVHTDLIRSPNFAILGQVEQPLRFFVFCEINLLDRSHAGCNLDGIRLHVYLRHPWCRGRIDP